ncbi:MAG: SLC13 family permease, partial [Mesotoga sp.]|nr:SLC13 family permease [Mesotoga sp.]
MPNISAAIYKTILNKRFIKRHLVKEMMFWISLLLALMTSIIIPPRIESIDWRVIAELLSLMIVVQALKEYKVLEKIATISLSNLRSARSIGSVIVILTAFMGALITNDVALIALVPLTLTIAEKAKFEPMWIVIIQSQAANIGSALTPIGNPQNLFLFEKYEIGIWEFGSRLLPFVVFGVCWTLVMNLLNTKRKIVFDVPSSEIREPIRLGIFI